MKAGYRYRPVTDGYRVFYLLALRALTRENLETSVTIGNRYISVTVKTAIPYRVKTVLRPENSVKSSSEKEPLLDVLCRPAQHI